MAKNPVIMCLLMQLERLIKSHYFKIVCILN